MDVITGLFNINFLCGSWLWQSVLAIMKKNIPEVTGGAYSISPVVNTLFFQFLTESVEDECPLSLPSGSTPRKQTNLALDVEFDRLHIGKLKCLSTDPARVSCSIMIFCEYLKIVVKQNQWYLVWKHRVFNYCCIELLWLNNGVCGLLPCTFGLLSVEKLTVIYCGHSFHV